jgi:hypothetical protein
MTEQKQRRAAFVDKRARALALMLLTRREDLHIEEGKDDLGLDFLVRFQPEGKEAVREFGIGLRGALTAGAKEHADRVLRPALEEVKRSGPFPRPVCLFLFPMEDDGAWYTWAAEPAVGEEGKPLLRYRDEPDCRLLNQRALKEIIDRVDLWHEVLFPSLRLNGPGGGKAERQGAKQ